MALKILKNFLIWFAFMVIACVVTALLHIDSAGLQFLVGCVFGLLSCLVMEKTNVR